MRKTLFILVAMLISMVANAQSIGHFTYNMKSEYNEYGEKTTTAIAAYINVDCTDISTNEYQIILKKKGETEQVYKCFYSHTNSTNSGDVEYYGTYADSPLEYIALIPNGKQENFYATARFEFRNHSHNMYYKVSEETVRILTK